MATAISVLRPWKDNKMSWTGFGGPTTAWEALDKTTPYEGGAGKPSILSGIETTTANAAADCSCGPGIGIPLGAKCLAVTLRCYCETTDVTEPPLQLQLIYNNSAGAEVFNLNVKIPTTTLQEWKSVACSKAQAEAILWSSGGTFAGTLDSDKASASKAFQMMVEVEYEPGGAIWVPPPVVVM